MGVLASGLGRRSSSHYSPTDSPNSPSLLVRRQFAFPILALLAALGLWLLLPGGALRAQESGVIEYPENGTGSVATFTGVDPENAGAVTWSLSEAVDVSPDFGVFTIGESDGVLSFKNKPDYEAAKDADMNNVYVLTVVATDAEFVTKSKAVMIEVTNLDEPGKVALTTEMDDPGLSGDEVVTATALAPHPDVEVTAKVTDADGVEGNSAEWQWSRSRSQSGGYTDIEDADDEAYTPTSADVGYYLRAKVSYDDREGDGKSAMATSANTVRAINSPNAAPEFPDQDADEAGVQNTDATREVGENAAGGSKVGSPVEAGDSDSDILTYTLEPPETLGGGVGDASVSFKIDAATGQITVGAKTKLDYETTMMYAGRVIAMDPAGKYASIELTIDVVDDADEPPAITLIDGNAVTSTESYSYSFAEPVGDASPDLNAVTFTAEDPDETSAAITWSLRGEDAGDFTIVGGALTFVNSPNYEAPVDADKNNVYKVTVGFADPDGNRGEQEVEVKVGNMDEDGMVTFSAVQPRVGVPLTASLTDIDGGVSNVTWQWTRGGSVTDGELSGGTAIDGATSDTYKPTSDDATETLAATASYTDAEGLDKMRAGQTANAVQTDTRNKAPKFADDQDPDTKGDQAEAMRTIAEGSKASESDPTVDNVGSPVTATDANNDKLTYTLGGTDAASFKIEQDDPSTTGDDEDESGQIKVAAGTKLDYETKSTYMVTVTATDSFGLSDSVDVIIMVTDVNEGPEIFLGGLAISGVSRVDYAEDRRDTVATYTASGPDAASARWSLDGDAAGDFAISSSGELTFVRAPDYETKSTYMVTVKADDGTYTATRNVVVTVTDVDEEVIGGTLLERYDTDNNGLDKSEVLKAINDYLFEDAISKTDVLSLINMYLFAAG